MGKEKNTKEISIESLDMDSENIGMGGYLTSKKNEEKYKERMKQRQRVQEERIKLRDKKKGLFIIFTGNGKGKTTAALGLILRAIGHGQKVAVIQFIKGGWTPGEISALKVFGEKVRWYSLGEGFTWETQDRKRDEELVTKSWKKALKYLKNEDYKLVILDEINVAIKLGYISIENVLQGIQNRKSINHVVLTGRNAAKELIEKADLVTEMKLIRHPFREQGIKAQEGIEY